MRSLDWRDGHIVAIDQTRLPGGLVEIVIGSVEELVIAIQRLAIRGAPALGAAGALGAALAVRADPARRDQDLAALRSARPTAVNLAWGVDRALARVDDGPDAVLAEALTVLAEDVDRNRALGRRGADWLGEQVDGPVSVQTHCNAGSLACVEWGTALGVVRSLHDRGRLRHVYVDETRPLLQGVRLTAWELAHLGVQHTVVADSAGPSVLARGLADAVVVGADRIVANGDVVNKIGTYPLALAAARAGVPFLVAAPESTIDAAIPSGDLVEIEVRDGSELLNFCGTRTAPSGTQALNLAFDVTPADLVSAIVTEDRLIRPARGERPA
ncbi:S-methyl-5-thioribose-1-phosphate isomerase [Actinophytocola xinjiangensis]|uniref:Methylthioribose-1-phosphate isomerase n=1 Tax=Actinophytocola xinjiangensis TaxID=485602 RepID=A0A7Z1AY04_9PSEU|nr:S-methyl-5-thioribose-1-phosphate isomerase [Actinophytocola xinjiangensis]OLF08493.1 S-methyl-5-thioribose-1-phosphate isomerase [Actinophytocola xinjiangensis]